MKKDENIFLDLKWENRNRVFNHIRTVGSVSAPELSYHLQLSRPTIKQNLDELLALGLIFESGSIGHTGGRNAKSYSIIPLSKVAIGVDITRNHISIIAVNLNGDLIYQQRIRQSFLNDDSYYQSLGKLINHIVKSVNIDEETILGVGIALPALITEDHKSVFYGNILNITGLTVDSFSQHISYPCFLFNDADAAGYGEVSQHNDLTDAFYISLSNNIGGAILIDQKVYKGQGSRSGEIGHTTLFPEGNHCYCGQHGCFETYCNAMILANLADGNLANFFDKLEKQDPDCQNAWQQYTSYLAVAVNNIRMLFDCQIILGGYVGAYIEKYLDDIKNKVEKRNSFEQNADYLRACKVKQEALALGAALFFIHDFWKKI